MPHALLRMAACGLVAACTPALASDATPILASSHNARHILVKQKLTYSQYMKDFTICAGKAKKQAPPDMSKQIVTLQGILTVDANVERRERLFRKCLISVGYREIAFPRCKGDAKVKADAMARKPLDRNKPLRFDATSCYVNAPDGRTVIYTAE